MVCMIFTSSNGIPFQKSVWEQLKKIPSGKTRSYADIALVTAKNLLLFMIRLPPIDLHSAINLLHQHQPHELMRQRHAAEAHALLGAAHHVIGEAMAASDDEHDMARPVGAEPVDFRGKLLGAPELAVDRERNDMRVALDVREDPFALARFDLDNLSIAEIVRCFFIHHLNDLKFEVWRQPLGIFCNAADQIFFLQFAYANNLNEHDILHMPAGSRLLLVNVNV